MYNQAVTGIVKEIFFRSVLLSFGSEKDSWSAAAGSSKPQTLTLGIIGMVATRADDTFSAAKIVCPNKVYVKY